MQFSGKHLIVVVGPTAVGKTALAVQLGKHFGTHVISADSRQFYKEMNIGTAKVTEEEMDGVPHHFVDFLDLEMEFSAGEFERQALKVLDQLFKINDVAIAAGGSGLYVNALCDGLDDVPKKDEKLRAELESLLENEGIESLQKKLKELDPEYFEIVDQDNPHRLIRALEVNMSSGQSFLNFRKSNKKKRLFNIHKIGLNIDREVLYERINQRVDQMMKDGLLEEAKNLHSKKDLNALNTVGYKELFAYLDDEISLKEAVELIKRNTRRYAKRQLTWYRKDAEVAWFEPGQTQDIIAHLESQTHA